jgi:hypothetical protein
MVFLAGFVKRLLLIDLFLGGGVKNLLFQGSVNL